MLARICQIVFFGVFAINHFNPFNGAQLIMAIAALILAIILIIGFPNPSPRTL